MIVLVVSFVMTRSGEDDRRTVVPTRGETEPLPPQKHYEPLSKSWYRRREAPGSVSTEMLEVRFL